MGLRRAGVELRVCAPTLVQYQAIPCLRGIQTLWFAKLRNELGQAPEKG